MWAIDVVNAVLGSSEAFKSLYMPLVRLFPEGASVDGNMLYHRVRTCGDVSVDIRYVPKDLLTQMECFPLGSRNHEMRKAILVSPWLLTGQNDPSLSADSHLNAKYINLNSLFHEVAHLLTPMINEELGREVERSYSKPSVADKVRQQFGNLLSSDKQKGRPPADVTQL